VRASSPAHGSSIRTTIFSAEGLQGHFNLPLFIQDLLTSHNLFKVLQKDIEKNSIKSFKCSFEYGIPIVMI
jgi:hypothetical protein